MRILLSPAKSLDFDSAPITTKYTLPEDLDRSDKVIRKLRSQSRKKLRELMNISQELAELNYQRYLDWDPDFHQNNSRIAIQAFNGDVYQGLDFQSFNEEDIDFAQDSIRILSGLHGLLRPLDLIKPYRLEMGTSLAVGRRKDLYHFWQEDVTRRLRNELAAEEHPLIVNLASEEYARVVDFKKLKVDIIKPVFKDYSKGQFKVLSFFAKKARGMMAAWIVKNRVEKAEELKKFNESGYRFSQDLSKENEWVFTRRQD